MKIVARTGEGKDFPATDIYLAIITENGAETPQDLDRKKPTILITASQHGNEHSGKEAALALIRDLAVGDLKPLLKQVNVLVMPQTNPFGNFVDKRPNEQGLDLNRDHVKLEAPSTRAIHAVFSRWMPEVTMDVHEKGYDYYRVNTGCVTNANIAAAIRRFSIDTDLQGDRGVREDERLHLARVPRDRGDGQPGRGRARPSRQTRAGARRCTARARPT